MLHLYQAIVLGVVQGVTEFLPISSTGHLRLIPRVFHWPDVGPTFDVALHFGTLLALLTYFWRDWIDVLRPVAAAIRGERRAASPHFGRSLFWGILIGCIPAVIAGYVFNKRIEQIETDSQLDTAVMATVAAALVIVAVLLWAADRFGSKRKKKLAHMSFFDWIAIGTAQAVALIPGVSRSGATITVGLACGLDRDAAARFSFLLSTPIFIGAAALKLADVLQAGFPRAEVAPFVAGMVSATVVGYFVIRWLLGYVRQHSMNVFVWYRLALGAAILAVVFVGR